MCFAFLIWRRRWKRFKHGGPSDGGPVSPASACKTGQSDGKKVKDRSGHVSVGQQRQVGRLCAQRSWGLKRTFDPPPCVVFVSLLGPRTAGSWTLETSPLQSIWLKKKRSLLCEPSSTSLKSFKWLNLSCTLHLCSGSASFFPPSFCTMFLCFLLSFCSYQYYYVNISIITFFSALISFFLLI